MIDRFQTVDTGAEVIRRADHLKINLYRGDGGEISSSFELSGSTSIRDDDQDADTLTADRVEALAFLKQLMAAFEAPK